MNNVATPNTPADPPHRTSHDLQEDNPDGLTRPAVSSPYSGSDSSQDHDDDDGSPVAQNPSLSDAAKEGLTKKLQFMTHLSISLDTVVYAELCALYYMDCSFFRLIIRWMSQIMFISPRPEDTILITPNYHVSAIVGPNVFCILMHLIVSLPSAGEASRGYLHGGILFDFIGQKAPTSKFSLLLLDLVVLGLQCFMLTVNMEKERIRRVMKPVRLVGAAGNNPTETMNPTTQDLDAEERGVLRDAAMVDETNDMELQPLRRNNSSSSGSSQQDVEERAGLLSRPTPPASDLEGLSDTLRSGNAILANFNLRRSLQAAWHNPANSPESAAAYTLQNVGYNATLAALAAQRRARMAAAQPRQP